MQTHILGKYPFISIINQTYQINLHIIWTLFIVVGKGNFLLNKIWLDFRNLIFIYYLYMINWRSLCKLNDGREQEKYCSLNLPFPFLTLNFKRDAIISYDFNMYQVIVIDQDLCVKFVTVWQNVSLLSIELMCYS